jgi:hypothetical protein
MNQNLNPRDLQIFFHLSLYPPKLGVSNLDQTMQLLTKWASQTKSLHPQQLANREAESPFGNQPGKHKPYPWSIHWTLASWCASHSLRGDLLTSMLKKKILMYTYIYHSMYIPTIVLVTSLPFFICCFFLYVCSGGSWCLWKTSKVNLNGHPHKKTMINIDKWCFILNIINIYICIIHTYIHTYIYILYIYNI